MSEYKKMLEQIEKLKAEAEAVRQRELQGVIADIRAKIAEHRITAKDLFGRSSSGKTKSAVSPKYRNSATGDTWTGRGRAPRWLVDAETAGKKRESFLI